MRGPVVTPREAPPFGGKFVLNEEWNNRSKAHSVLFARIMARYFEEITRTGMVITNMPGGATTIATSAVRDAEPEGSIDASATTGPAPLLVGLFCQAAL